MRKRTEDSGHDGNHLLDSTEAEKKTTHCSKKEKMGPEDIHTAKVMRVLGNPDVMEHLASFLDNQELGSLY